MTERQDAAEGGFRRRPLIALIALAGVLAAVALYFTTQGEQQERKGGRATTSVSRSALGFYAYAEFLRELGYTVSRNRLEDGPRAAPRRLAVIASPRSGQELREALERFDDATAVLIIAPKRFAVRSRQPRRRVVATGLYTPEDVEAVLQAADPRIRIARGPALAAPIISPFSAAPSAADAYLAAEGGRALSLYPIRAGLNGALLQEVQRAEPKIWLLTDPDPLANHGLGHGANALFAAALTDALIGATGHVVFDEAMNGSIVAPTIYAQLFELPWLSLTIALAALILAIALAATGRFGTPKEATAGVAAGRASLVRATARLNLIEDGGRSALARYFRHMLRAVATRRRAPGADDAGRLDWLDRMATKAGKRADGKDLEARAAALAQTETADPAALLAAGRRIHRWRTEQLNERE